jgi:hypothetical protein
MPFLCLKLPFLAPRLYKNRIFTDLMQLALEFLHPAPISISNHEIYQTHGSSGLTELELVPKDCTCLRTHSNGVKQWRLSKMSKLKT